MIVLKSKTKTVECVDKLVYLTWPGLYWKEDTSEWSFFDDKGFVFRLKRKYWSEEPCIMNLEQHPIMLKLTYKSRERAERLVANLFRWHGVSYNSSQGAELEGECEECFGTGLKGGFQAACSRGCVA